MSRLEQRAKPLIISMMSTAPPGSAVILTPDQTASLATWAIKTAWMSEESDPGRRTTTQEMRRALYRYNLPPEHSAVWAGRHVGSLDFHIRQAQIQVARSDRPWDSNDVRQVLWTGLIFCGIAFLAYTVDGWGVAPPQRDPSRWVQLWPSSADVRYPPPGPVSDFDVLLAVVNQSPNIHLPVVDRFVRDPFGVRQHRRN